MLFGIVGAGTAGILVALELIRLGIPANQIHMIDPFFDGGALIRTWGSIQSNTRWEQIRDALADYESAKSMIDELNLRYTPEQTVVLSDLGLLLNSCIESYRSDIHTYTDTCKKITFQATKPVIHMTTADLVVDKVFLCQGGISKSVDCGKPSIPLNIALDKDLLKRYVKAGQTVCVFGLAHSGTVVLNHLQQLGANAVGFFKNSDPFLFARDGHYDGIKQESADIADRILSKKYESIQLYRYDDLNHLIKSITKSTWVISCIGFKSSPMHICNEQNTEIDSTVYSPQTAEICQNIYGFGLAYPGITELNGKMYKDVSIPSFVQQIQRCLPEILKNNQS